MRPWDMIDQEDLERMYGKQNSKEDWIKLHKDLQEACNELGDGGDLTGSDQLDDELIAIERVLEVEYKMTDKEIEDACDIT